jgi:hypothetical protein
MIEGWAETDDVIVECLRRAGSMSVASPSRLQFSRLERSGNAGEP